MSKTCSALANHCIRTPPLTPLLAISAHHLRRLYKEGKDTSPLTNERLPHKVLVPCATMTRCIEEVWDYICKMRASVL